MPRILIAWFVVAIAMCPAFSQVAPELRMRVLNYKTGHPMKGWEVGLIGKNEVIARTGKDGVAVFRMTDSLPDVVQINPEAGSWSHWSCIDIRDEFDVAVVLEQGAIGRFLSHPLCQPHTLEQLRCLSPGKSLCTPDI